MENEQAIEEKLLSLLRDFIAEFKPERALQALHLNAALERDLGIDSLGRVELFLRIEKAFTVVFPESLLATADTVKDIAQALHQSQPGTLASAREFAAILQPTQMDPSHCVSLLEVLVKYGNLDPKRPQVYLINDRNEQKIIRYGELLEAAKKVASGLLALGLKPRETVAIMLPTCEDFFYAFFGVLLAGGVPVPIYPPFRPDKIEEYAVREAAILNNAAVRVLITFSQVETLSNLLRIFIRSLTTVTTVPDLKKMTGPTPHIALNAEDPAMIQYTSGSTSSPKGVLLSHANLLANIRSVGKAIQINSVDVGVSWLPLYHDMGLIGAWFCSLYYGFPLTLMSPLTFLTRPERWLWAIHYHRGTLSAGPNFAYELCVRKIKEEDIQGLDLSSWRLAFNGAEMINPKTLERFSKKFEPFGFNPQAFYPVYGLAECSVALSFPPLNRGPRIDVIDRTLFETERLAVSAGKENNNYLEFVGCGYPIPEHEVRIVDESNQELEDRKIGRLQFSGPSAMQGYYKNSEATQASYHEGWWDSGDFAYLAEGEVFITGRVKDIIIKAGRNLYPQEIEEVAEQVTGVRKGSVVAFGVSDAKWGTEKLVVLAETAETKRSVRDRIIAQILEKISIVLGFPPDQVTLLPLRALPKTSSGKLQRSASKKLYLEGKLAKAGLPVWLQMVKLFAKGAGVSLLLFVEKGGLLLYTVYIAALLLFLLPFSWAWVMLLPRTKAVWGVRKMSRLLIFLSGIRFKVEGSTSLNSAQPIIYACNHASYTDSLFLLAALPSSVVFVVKKDLEHWPLIGRMVRKLGYLTADRVDFSKNLADTQQMVEAVQQGHSLVIFPEGTFTYATGLRPFKMGAFKIAVETGALICPVSIKGSRSLLRAHSFLIHPGKVEVTLSSPIAPQAQDWPEVLRLHSLVRQEIAKHSGELSINLVTAGPLKT